MCLGILSSLSGGGLLPLPALVQGCVGVGFPQPIADNQFLGVTVAY